MRVLAICLVLLLCGLSQARHERKPISALANLKARILNAASDSAQMQPRDEAETVAASSQPSEGVKFGITQSVLTKLKERVHHSRQRAVQRVRDLNAADKEYLTVFLNDLPYTWAANAKLAAMRTYYNDPTNTGLDAAPAVKAWVNAIRTFAKEVLVAANDLVTIPKNQPIVNLGANPATVIIVGAGPAGLSSALHALQRNVFAFTMYEKRCDFTRMYPVDLHPENAANGVQGNMEGELGNVEDGVYQHKGMLNLVKKLGMAAADTGDATEVGAYFGYHKAELPRITISNLQKFLAAAFMVASGVDIQFGKGVIETRKPNLAGPVAEDKPPVVTNRFAFENILACTTQATNNQLLKPSDGGFKTAIEWALTKVLSTHQNPESWPVAGLNDTINFYHNTPTQLSEPGALTQLEASKFLIFANGGGIWNSHYPLVLMMNAETEKLEERRNRYGPIMYFVYIFKDPAYKAPRSELPAVDNFVCKAIAAANWGSTDRLPGIVTTSIFSKKYKAGDDGVCTLEVPFTAAASRRLEKTMSGFMFPKPADKTDADEYKPDKVTKLTVMYRVLKALDARAGTTIADAVFGTWRSAPRLLEAKAYMNEFRAAANPSRKEGTRGIFMVGDTLRDALPQFAMGVNTAALHGAMASAILGDANADMTGFGPLVGNRLKFEFTKLVPKIQAQALGIYYQDADEDLDFDVECPDEPGDEQLERVKLTAKKKGRRQARIANVYMQVPKCAAKVVTLKNDARDVANAGGIQWKWTAPTKQAPEGSCKLEAKWIGFPNS